MFFAEVAADPVIPWVGLVVQSGALGVLIILVIRIPRYMREARLMVQAWEASAKAERREMREAFMELLKHLRRVDELPSSCRPPDGPTD